MDEQYDVIVLGTGLKECILSGLLSVNKFKVLHMDRNNYYGGESASLQLSELYKQHGGGKSPPEKLGPAREWNVDLVPKLIMASGKLVQMLIHTNVTRYLEFKSVDGSFVVAKNKIHKVPASDGEAVRSGLLGLLEKNRARKFFQFLQDFDLNKPKTHQGLDVKNIAMKAVYKKFGLSEDTQDFIGHSLALYTEDSYLEKPALPTIEKIRLYFESLSRYGKSPYIYPLYGLGELPQGFARLSAIYGGTYMLDRKFESVEVDGSGKFVGVKAGGEVAKAKFVVGDPSYFPKRVKKIGQVVRAICILDHPIKNTRDSESLQIIIPQKACKRGSDIYISLVSSTHHVANKGYYLAMVSTTVETKDPPSELRAGLDLLGPIVERFIFVKDVYEPLDDGRENRIFISKSYDATSHFETSSHDIEDLWRRITGKELDLTPPKDEGAASSSS